MKTKNVIVFLLFAMCAINSAMAQGNLLLTPGRVILDKDKRSEDITLYNMDKDTVTYNVSFIHKRMFQDGSIQTDTTIQNADKYLRIYPRRVTLAPKESQAVKVQMRMPSEGSSPDELRSHLVFRADKPTVALGMEQKNDKGVSISIRPIFGLSIPIIIRTGHPELKVELSDLSVVNMNDSTVAIKLRINRIGNISAYGDIKVVFAPVGGSAMEINTTSGIGVYAEVPYREFSFVVKKSPVNLKKGTYVVTFTMDKNQIPTQVVKKEFEINE